MQEAKSNHIVLEIFEIIVNLCLLNGLFDLKILSAKYLLFENEHMKHWGSAQFVIIEIKCINNFRMFTVTEKNN